MADLNKLPQVPGPCQPAGVTDQRGADAFRVRFGTAKNEAVPTAKWQQTPNGDEAKYGDKSATYSKGLKQDAFGVVNPAVFKAFRVALGSNDGKVPGTADLENAAIVLGGDRKLNGPLGAFARTLAGADSEYFFGSSLVPPAPEVASKQYATELVELYWASLLRDVPFTEFENHPTAVAAAKELTKLAKTYAGPLDKGKVTPKLLFRGGFNGSKDHYFAGEDVGPYVSQFCIRPTNLGAQQFDQMMVNYVTGRDNM